MSEQRLHNWGGYPTMTATLHAPARPEGVRLAPGRPVIARGNGRCYGDSALQATVLTAISGASGASYGESMPVKFFSSPRLAFL